MQKSVYEDYKYCIQDTNCVYVGSKYTLNEIAENEDIAFKFRKVCAESLKKDSDGEDTLESILYYLEPGDFRVQVLKQMRAKVRVNMIKEKKHLFGKPRKEYVTEFMSIPELVSMSVPEKEKVGLVIHEIRVNKLALLTV
ncbi:MAG: hypothetical protein IJ796_05125 [Lachnospiraceae bacterium]|nr:hypothetical protein [Lachnospiraceae bacterium]